jgi:hypothetical protein
MDLWLFAHSWRAGCLNSLEGENFQHFLPYGYLIETFTIKLYMPQRWGNVV